MKILRPVEIHLLRCSRPVVPANIGGDSESDSSTQTTNNTTNNVRNEDKRNVVSDAAVGISGNFNSVNTDRSVRFADNSDRSVRFSDSSNRSTTTNTTNNTTVTDFGSVGKALDSVTLMGKSAVGLADDSIAGSFGLLREITASNLTAAKSVFEAARTSSQNTMDFAREVTNEAKNGNEKTITLAALGIAGAVALAFAFK